MSYRIHCGLLIVNDAWVCNSVIRLTRCYSEQRGCRNVIPVIQSQPQTSCRTHIWGQRKLISNIGDPCDLNPNTRYIQKPGAIGENWRSGTVFSIPKISLAIESDCHCRWLKLFWIHNAHVHLEVTRGGAPIDIKGWYYFEEFFA